ncbi:class I histocompatibility antigen, Gogo-A*0201 alpha chain-like [Choloepus didactylus]|uniref:class I histocompatibility antigen, Gogo-A*0201 alpha chain-like n=1 Tax=Choloepus didactylus TaxID=27675 RepID=UPI00189D8DC7|nr:class I histocompatibility antigen, Gogo-A*0201 alpha chain-like [Choloepus didactylus]
MAALSARLCQLSALRRPGRTAIADMHGKVARSGYLVPAQLRRSLARTRGSTDPVFHNFQHNRFLFVFFLVFYFQGPAEGASERRGGGRRPTPGTLGQTVAPPTESTPSFSEPPLPTPPLGLRPAGALRRPSRAGRAAACATPTALSPRAPRTPRAPELRTGSAGTGTLGRRAELATGGPRSPRSARAGLRLVLLLLGLVPPSAAESPWGLPVVADGPASVAKEVMAQLATMKLENKPWPGGTHSLHYHYLALSEPGSDLPDFLAVGYVDDQPFIRYDSRLGRAKPQAPWVAPIEAQYWETETQKQRAWEKVQQVEMWTVMGYHNQSSAPAPAPVGGGRLPRGRGPRPGAPGAQPSRPACSGLHSAQRTFGCEIRADGSTGSFWQFGFDGQDHLTLDLETLSWVSAEPLAVRTKRWWEMERCYAEYDKAYLEGLCLSSLRRYLELGGRSLTRRDPPKVQVTKHLDQDGGAVLKCWALGFYPKDITLSWWLGGEELALETERVETRPSGDGTYQTWAAVQVRKGTAESHYSCHVQHPGLNNTLTVVWEPPSCCGPTTVIIIAILVTALLVAGVLVCTAWLRARNKASYNQAPGGEDLHESQGPAREEAAQHLC